jgi:hypothetical protein
MPEKQLAGVWQHDRLPYFVAITGRCGTDRSNPMQNPHREDR